MSTLSSQKFASLTIKRKHKHAALILQQIIEGNKPLIPLYSEFEEILDLEPLIFDEKKVLERLFDHEAAAGIPYSLQYKIEKGDKTSETKMLEIDIYLENLRSMHNIGSILRTTEAFRLGTIYISKQLPLSALTQIKKTAMGAEQSVRIKVIDDPSKLRKPLIAIETGKDAIDCNNFKFPKCFTLLFGNEQYGLTDEALALADKIVRIPLYGNKNSLNVSTAFSIIANCIRNG